MVPFSVFKRRPKIALVALKVKSVTPTVNVVGAAGASGTGGAGAGVVVSPSAAGAVTGAAGAALGAGLPTTTTWYLFNSNNCFKNATRSGLAFF